MKTKLPGKAPKKTNPVPTSLSDRIWALEICAAAFLSVVSVIIAAFA